VAASICCLRYFLLSCSLVVAAPSRRYLLLLAYFGGEDMHSFIQLTAWGGGPSVTSTPQCTCRR
jgi:hypothetical protein